MSYAEERSEAIRRRNDTNRRRAAFMERRVAQYLGGHRVPLSGAGSIKGDGHVYSESIGYILLECKTTDRMNTKTGEPVILLDTRWMEKMRTEVKAMRATLGLLVFHYHNVRTDYVVVHRDSFEKFFGGAAALEGALIMGTNGHLSIRLEHSQIEAALVMKPSQPSAFIIQGNYGEYVVMRLPEVKELIHAV